MTQPKRNDTRSALRIASIERPGWEAAAGRVPSVGERVYCLEGPGEVIQVLGKTGDGSRLLELKLDDHKAPFFAAASNVLLRVEGAEPELPPQPTTTWLSAEDPTTAAHGR